MKQYTNELTPEMLAAFDESPFTAEQLAGMNDEARSLIEKQNAYNLAHPVTAAYLIATEGSLTRNGGKFSVNITDGRSNLMTAQC